MKILLVDDHQIFRASLIRLLRSIYKGLNSYEEAKDGKEALEKLGKSKFDLVILDVSMPVMDGYEASRILRQDYPSLPIIILTQFDDYYLISHFVRIGINSFLTKDANITELKCAIDSALKNEKFLSDKIERILRVRVSFEDSHQVELAPQEKVLIQLLQQGKTSKDIAQHMGLTIKTVRTYRERLLDKTKTKNVAELISFGFRTGHLFYSNNLEEQ
ncbi:MAG: response regulator transcription factor [Bacteroidetes bacterium]|nr:response regulator transcription factor [Bacteroidota bacterium]